MRLMSCLVLMSSILITVTVLHSPEMEQEVVCTLCYHSRGGGTHRILWQWELWSHSDWKEDHSPPRQHRTGTDSGKQNPTLHVWNYQPDRWGVKVTRQIQKPRVLCMMPKAICSCMGPWSLQTLISMAWLLKEDNTQDIIVGLLHANQCSVCKI